MVDDPPGSKRAFQILALSTEDSKTQYGKDRVERLLLRDGGQGIAVVLFRQGRDKISVFAQRQAEYVGHASVCLSHTMPTRPRSLLRNSPLPILPITSAAELSSGLGSLRGRYASGTAGARPTADLHAARSLLSQCVVDGPPLSEKQTNIVSYISSGFGHLASLAGSLEGQRLLRPYLGESDAGRLIAFLTRCPT